MGSCNKSQFCYETFSKKSCVIFGIDLYLPGLACNVKDMSQRLQVHASTRRGYVFLVLKNFLTEQPVSVAIEMVKTYEKNTGKTANIQANCLNQ